jgi:hypothetical protein
VRGGQDDAEFESCAVVSPDAAVVALGGGQRAGVVDERHD